MCVCGVISSAMYTNHVRIVGRCDHGVDHCDVICQHAVTDEEVMKAEMC